MARRSVSKKASRLHAGLPMKGIPMNSQQDGVAIDVEEPDETEPENAEVFDDVELGGAPDEPEDEGEAPDATPTLEIEPGEDDD